MKQVKLETLTDEMIQAERMWLHDAKIARGIPSESQMTYERYLSMALDGRIKKHRREFARQRICDAINSRRKT